MHVERRGIQEVAFSARRRPSIAAVMDAYMALDDVEKGLQFHIDERTSKLIAAGRPPDEARIERGGMVQMQEIHAE